VKKLLILGFLAFILFLGCGFATRDFYLGEDDFPDEFTGTLLLRLNGSALPNPKLVVPSTVSMLVSTYNLSFVYTEGSGYDFPAQVTYPDNDYLRSGLKTGAWTVSITAVDSTGQSIGAIDGDEANTFGFTIDPGLVTVIGDEVGEEILILPIVGVGDLSLIAVWPSGAVEGTATLDAYLVQADQIAAYNAAVAAAGDLSSYLLLDDSSNGFTIGSGIATYGVYDSENPFDNMDDATEETGYYQLFITLRDDGTKVLGITDTVRIIDGHESHGTIDLTVEAGGIDIGWDVDLKNPVEIAFTTVPADATLPPLLASGASIDVIAGITPPTPASDTYSYSWYVDGVATSETTNTFTITNNGTYTEGNHHLTVLVTGTTNSNIDSLSSANFPFAIQ